MFLKSLNSSKKRPQKRTSMNSFFHSSLALLFYIILSNSKIGSILPQVYLGRIWVEFAYSNTDHIKTISRLKVCNYYL